MNNKFTITLAYCLLLSTLLSAQAPGSLDNTFGTSGKVITQLSKTWSEVIYDTKILADDKILATGIMNEGKSKEFFVIRYTQNGVVDNTFGTNGLTTVGFEASSDDRGQNLFVQPDGKIIVVGDIIVSQISKIGIVRLNSNGTIDNTFGKSGKVIIDNNLTKDSRVYGTFQNDGKIVVAYTTKVNDKSTFSLARVDKDGNLDSTFGKSGISTLSLLQTADFTVTGCLFNNNKIIILGHTFSWTFYTDVVLVRCNLDGTIDNTFGTKGITQTNFKGDSETPFAIAMQQNKIIVAGYTSITSSNNDMFTIRYDENGVIDKTYGTEGVSIIDIANKSNDVAWAVLVQPDNKVIVGGYSIATGNNKYADICVYRLEKDGTLDNTFGKNVSSLGSEGENIYSLALQKNGKLIAAGSSLDPSPYADDLALVRYNTGLVVKAIDYQKTQVNVYPNPFDNTLNIAIPETNMNDKVLIQIYDISGRLLKQLDTNNGRLITINEIEGFENGVYILEVEIDNIKQQFKVIKNN